MNKAKSEVKIDLSCILKDLSNQNPMVLKDDKVKKQEYLDKFEKYYNNNSRHKYSEITRIVYNIFEDSSNEEDDVYIKKNLDIIYKESNTEETLSKNLFKLIDHVELAYDSKRREENLSGKKILEFQKKIIENLLRKEIQQQNKIKELEEKYKENLDNINSSKNKLDNLTVDLISVLGVFAAIVIVFLGSSDIFKSIFSSISTLGISGIAIIVLLVGLILMNCFFYFFYALSKITGKSIRSDCLDDKCDECKNKCKNVKQRMKRLYPLIYYINIIFIVLILLAMIVNKIN